MIEDQYITIETRRNGGKWQVFDKYELAEFCFDEERFDDAEEAFRYSKNQTYENTDAVMQEMVERMLDPLNWDENFENTSGEDFRVTLREIYEKADSSKHDDEIVSIEYRGEILQHIFPEYYAYKKPVKRTPKQRKS